MQIFVFGMMWGGWEMGESFRGKKNFVLVVVALTDVWSPLLRCMAARCVLIRSGGVVLVIPFIIERKPF